VEEPAHRWMSQYASGGACAPVEPAHRWRSSHAGGAARRWRSPLTDAPFSGGMGVKGSAADPGSRGAVEDVGMPLPLSWSHGTRPVPEEDASVTTVLVGDDGLDSPPVHRSPEGRTWKCRQ
jgi:hypothetical protein